MKSSLIRRLRGAAACAALFPGLVAATDIAVGWQSRYITEGRDNLTDGGLVTAEAGESVGGWSGLAWLGVGDATDYREINLTAAYTGQLGPTGWTVGVTRLLFKPDDATDTEVSLDVSTAIGATTLSASTVYSEVANGTFVLLGAAHDWALGDEGLVATGFIRQGLDYGYASASNDGASHTATGLTYTQPLTSRIQLEATASHSFAGPDVRRSGGDDVTWLTIQLRWATP